MPLTKSQQKSESQAVTTNRGYGLLILIINVVITLVFWWQLPPEIPLYYTMPYGKSQLAAKIWFLLLPLLSIVCFAMGQFLAKLKLRSSLFSVMIGWLETLCLFLLMLAMIHIVMVTL